MIKQDEDEGDVPSCSIRELDQILYSIYDTSNPIAKVHSRWHGINFVLIFMFIAS